MSEHDRIWLEPKGAPDRCWCEDNQWGDEGVEYVRAALSASIPAEIGELVERLERQVEIALTYAADEKPRHEKMIPSVFELQVGHLRDIGAEMASALRALSVRNGELREALEPLCLVAYPGEAFMQFAQDMHGVTVVPIAATPEEIRRARAALDKGENGNG